MNALGLVCAGFLLLDRAGVAGMSIYGQVGCWAGVFWSMVIVSRIGIEE